MIKLFQDGSMTLPGSIPLLEMFDVLPLEANGWDTQAFIEFFRSCGDNEVVLLTSSSLSCPLYFTAYQAARELSNVYVLDSGQQGIGYLLQLIGFAQLIDRGESVQRAVHLWKRHRKQQLTMRIRPQKRLLSLISNYEVTTMIAGRWNKGLRYLSAAFACDRLIGAVNESLASMHPGKVLIGIDGAPGHISMQAIQELIDDAGIRKRNIIRIARNDKDEGIILSVATAFE